MSAYIPPLGAMVRSRLDWELQDAFWLGVGTNDVGAANITTFFLNTSSRGLYYALLAALVGTTAGASQMSLFSRQGAAGVLIAPWPQAVHTPYYTMAALKLDNAPSTTEFATYEYDRSPTPASTLWTGNLGGASWGVLCYDAPLAIVPVGYSLGVWTNGGGFQLLAMLFAPWRHS